MNVYRLKIGFTICLAAIMLLSATKFTLAQGESNWSEPYRLSSIEGNASEGFMVSDQYGYLHVFWIENGLPGGHSIIQYARFDGETWSEPIDIFATARRGEQILYLSPFIDQHGRIHLIWVGGISGPIRYITALATDALSAQKWSNPVRIFAPAYRAQLLIDSEDVLHILYSDFYGQVPGMYYIRSTNHARSWEDPIWIDPDIPTGQAPSDIRFELGKNNSLHAAWNYMDLENASMQAIRYANSLDGGNTWSLPITIDEAGESADEVRAARPNLIVQGETVHLIWAGTKGTNREHRYSTDSGQIWGIPARIFGELHGEAIGDGLAIDSIGRIHFVGQIRYPQGIYHAYWDKDHWSNPLMFYLIAADSEADLGDRIHAHHVRLGIRNGNQLVTTFTNSPGEGNPLALYTMHHTLDDAPPLSPLPTPTPEPTATLKPQTNLGPIGEAVTPVPTRPKYTGDTTPPVSKTPSPGYPLWLGLAPVVLILGGAVTFQLIRRW